MSSLTSPARWFSCLCHSSRSPSGVGSRAVGRLQLGPFQIPLCAWPHQLPARQFVWRALSSPVPQQLRSGPERISQMLTAWSLRIQQYLPLFSSNSTITNTITVANGNNTHSSFTNTNFLWPFLTRFSWFSSLEHSSLLCSRAISRVLSLESFFSPDEAKDDACSLRSSKEFCTDNNGIKRHKIASSCVI